MKIAYSAMVAVLDIRRTSNNDDSHNAKGVSYVCLVCIPRNRYCIVGPYRNRMVYRFVH